MRFFALGPMLLRTRLKNARRQALTPQPSQSVSCHCHDRTQPSCLKEAPSRRAAEHGEHGASIIRAVPLPKASKSECPNAAGIDLITCTGAMGSLTLVNSVCLCLLVPYDSYHPHPHTHRAHSYKLFHYFWRTRRSAWSFRSKLPKLDASFLLPSWGFGPRV